MIFFGTVHIFSSPVRGGSVLWQLKHLFRFYSLHAGAMDSSNSSHNGNIMTSWKFTFGLKKIQKGFYYLNVCCLLIITGNMTHKGAQQKSMDYLHGYN